MRKMYVRISAFMMTIVLLLTGCGDKLPDMTYEEEQVIGEYAAKLLLKYDANNRSRLVSREEVAVWESELKKKEENKIPESSQGGMEPVEDTPTIEIGQETTGGAVGSIESFYELPEGVKVVYQGNQVCDSYSPDGDRNDYFALDASEGKKLLVLKFSVMNEQQTEQTVDFLTNGAVMRATVNGDNKYNVLTTMLMNDLSTYKGIIPAAGSVELVLLMEINDNVADSISSLNLNFKSASKTCTITL